MKGKLVWIFYGIRHRISQVLVRLLARMVGLVLPPIPVPWETLFMQDSLGETARCCLFYHRFIPTFDYILRKGHVEGDSRLMPKEGLREICEAALVRLFNGTYDDPYVPSKAFLEQIVELGCKKGFELKTPLASKSTAL